MDVKGLPLHLSARVRTVVGSMGHLLLAPTLKTESSPNDVVDALLVADRSRAGGGREDVLVLAVEPASTETEPAARAGEASGPVLSAQAIADTALVRRVQQGDMAAFEELFHKYNGVIYRTALAITRDPGVAEEVLQDSFYKAYTNIHRIQPDVPLLPWLHRVAVNLSCNALKRRRHWLEPLENLAERLFADPHHSPEHLYEQNELQGALRDIVNTLPVKHRIVVVLHYLHDLSLPEIAAILDCPVGTVKSRLHYARKVLKIELETHYLAEPVLGVPTEPVAVV